jgi:hypothetical protein
MFDCLILGKVKRDIPYYEIKDYGIFWLQGTKFIYISRIELTEYQINVQAYLLYKKSKDVIAVEFHEEIINKLDSVTNVKKVKI